MESTSAQWQSMLAGELYDPADSTLVQARTRAQQLCRRYNNVDPELVVERKLVLEELLASFGERSEIVAPFHCDYGCHIRIGDGVFLNFGVVVLDCAWITIGTRVKIGPGVQIYGATHPVEASIRATGKESARPVVIGNDTWIGGGAILCPGVTIGSGTTIGAGSVVTRNIPSNVIAAGNPCRVIRQLDNEPVSIRQVP
jgi:maltose O-acetyltransferase